MRSLVRNKVVLALFGCVLTAAIAIPVLVLHGHATPAHANAAVGSMDCNGYSKVQKPLRPLDTCTDFVNPANSEYRGRGYDNGHYVGHDEPAVQFLSTTPGSGNNVRWNMTLPTEHALPATQTLENQIAFWYSMALCDPNSFPAFGTAFPTGPGEQTAPCTPDSDSNQPFGAGSAFLEMQFYPPGNPPFITNISCDTTHWCASLHINSLEAVDIGGQLFTNPNCAEPTNFAFVQRNGVPTGPAGPDNSTPASATPDGETLLMNQGDHIQVTIKDTAAGLMVQADDQTTGQSGFMVASAANGFQTLDPNTCAGTPFAFHPEYSTASFGNFVPWAALQANVGFSIETGHFQPGANGDNDSDDAPCFASGVNVPGCIGGDGDFDGTSYLADWPDGTANTATSLQILSGHGNALGPASNGNSHSNAYNDTYGQMLFETDVPASDPNCDFGTGNGCVAPPAGAAFYPFYALQSAAGNGNGQCALTFGNDIAGATRTDFGKDAQYGPSNLAWFAGDLSSGPVANPCIH